MGMRCSYDRKGQPMSENDFIIVDEEETNKEDNRQDTGREEEKREETKFSIITTYSISDHPASITLRKEECKEGYHFKTNK